MSDPTIVAQDEWIAARKALLAKEKELTRLSDALAAERRALPATRVERDYRFDTAAGLASLPDLFRGRSQLAVYHFMFGPDWAEPCPSCSFWADNLDGVDAHLAARDVTFLCVSTAPLERLLAYRDACGWRFDWASAADRRFNIDFGVSFAEDVAAEGARVDGYNYSGRAGSAELPGLSVFLRAADGGVLHSYSTFARGLEPLNGAYQLLDMTPKGRDEDALDFTMAWIRRRADYEPRSARDGCAG